jgi:hypothetical protein
MLLNFFVLVKFFHKNLSFVVTLLFLNELINILHVSVLISNIDVIHINKSPLEVLVIFKHIMKF